MIQGIVFQLQSLTDKAFLGNIDTKYVSAIGAAQIPLNATFDSLVAICTGLAIIIARLYGAGDENKIRKYTKCTVFFNSLIGIAIFIAWQFGAHGILSFFQVDKSIIDYSVQYVKICSFYLIVLGIDSSLQAMLQGMGKTNPIMYAGIIKVGLNILLSWILIFGHFGFPAMYVTGAALGMLIANVISALMIVIYCFVIKKKDFNLHKDSILWFQSKPYKDVFNLGIPTGLEYLLWNVSNLMLIRLINGFSYREMAIYTLTFGMQCIIFALFSGSGRAALTSIGQSLGAENQKMANSFFYSGMLLNFIIVVFAGVFLFAFPEKILGVFSKDTDLITKTVPYLCFTAIIMLSQSMNVICGNAIRANNDTKWMLISQILGSIIVISVSWFLIKVMHLGMIAIYITLFLDETIRGIVNYVYYIKRYRG